ncbi:hypothetical protein ES708_08952 [subsurface metagenome]
MAKPATGKALLKAGLKTFFPIFPIAETPLPATLHLDKLQSNDKTPKGKNKPVPTAQAPKYKPRILFLFIVNSFLTLKYEDRKIFTIFRSKIVNICVVIITLIKLKINICKT